MTIDIGRTNRLRAARRAPPGVYLERGGREVLLPNRFVPQDLELGSELDVFVYTDSRDRPVATTQKPHAQVGEFAFLRVVDESQHGAFFDWGLDKDLFAPLAEQESRLSKGDSAVVAVCLDEQTQRVIASTRLGQFLEPAPSSLPVAQSVGADGSSGDAPVELLVYRRTELGTMVIVDGRYSGLVFENETFTELAIGDRVQGYVRRRRDDGKLDVSLRAPGAAGRENDTRLLLLAIERNGGHLPLGDASAPEEISRMLGMSKKAFKRAAGSLYRQRLVRLEPLAITAIDRKK
jgi:predicted RNA-binding protein (virulence factor B family)